MNSWRRRILPLLLVCGLIGCAGPIQSSPDTAQQLPTTAHVPSPTMARTTPTVPNQSLATPTVTPTITQTSIAPSSPLDLALVGGTVIDGSGAAPLVDAVVTIRGDQIVAVGRASEITIPAGIPIRDVHRMTILPGIVNAHAHSDTLTDDQLQQWTRTGVTTVRDLGGPRGLLIRRRATLAKRPDPGLPRLLVAGPIVTVPGGHPIPVYGLNDEVLVVQGTDDARAKVAALLDDGVDVVKIAVSGRSDVDWPELSNEEIRTIVETAHARGVRVAAHIDRAVALQRAVEQGIDDAAHMPRDRIPDDLIAQMVERDVVLIPTIAVYEALAEERGQAAAWRRMTLPIMQDNLRRFVAAGGTLALGDDYGNPGVALGMPMAEMRHWLQAGLSPMQVIVAATHGGAIACGLAEEIGEIRAGTVADLLVVEGDPLADINALERVALVIHNGVVIMP